ncbi:conserved hypothetical protein [Luminiphilus syltensis NOR5-1B]|uniref:Uncharacterized protein n=1 Tax=Luminiphilus syltensis NOR5-1B TaxID=565045 RepID=B8KWS0_9GAMM|nr:ferric reductase-like transmembrane domain-containing protein [Luminiphilus syltensis]EED35032.1 conserved hypothetical protein [Luminiphilus syltensis NOR5-1B]
MTLRWLLNGWPLFWLLSVPITAAMLLEMRALDMANPESVSHMIQFSVRFAVPFIFIVVASTALPVLFPSTASRWCLRNRRYIGLIFAVAMAWQGAFIFWVSTTHATYYYSDIYFLRDELEGSSGYIFLVAMVLTSFDFGRRRITPNQWKVLHRSGIYFLWAYPFSVYWWNLYYYGNPVTLDYVYYAMGFLAFLARIAAWGKKRQSAIARSAMARPGSFSRGGGFALITLGLMASVTGSAWRESVSQWLLSPEWSANLELWLPYWPFEPFLPLIAIGLGTWLWTGSLRVVDMRVSQKLEAAAS